MKDCNLKVYEKEVNNNDLPLVDAILIKRIYDANLVGGANTTITLRSQTDKLSLSISNVTAGVGCFENSASDITTDTGVREATITKQFANSKYLSNGSYDLVISPKYANLTYAQLRKCVFADRLESIVKFFDVTQASSINITDSTITGDIKCFAELQHLTGLRINGTQIYGDITSLGNLIETTGLMHFAGSKVTGSVRALANLLKANGKKSSTFQYVPSSYMTDKVGTKQDDTYTITFDANGDWE